MGPSNKKKHSKAESTTSTQPRTSTGSFDNDNTTADPTASVPDKASFSASATCVAFCKFIELASLENIKHFITIASSTPGGEDLKLLWGRGFKEGLVAGHLLHGRTEEKLKEAHDCGYEEGFRDGSASKIDLFQAGFDEGRRDEQEDWLTNRHGLHCFPPTNVCSVQTDPPSLLTTSTSTVDDYILPTQISPPLEVFTLSHSFQPETLISARNVASVKSEPNFEIARNFSEHIPINSEQLLGITRI